MKWLIWIACLFSTMSQAEVLSLYSNINRNLHAYPDDFPLNPRGRNPLLSEARAFYTRKDGKLGLLTLEHQYRPKESTPETAKNDRLEFYVRDEGHWRISDVIVNFKTSQSIHARKVLQADFNGDGVIDFVIMCHGYDATPYPGERSKVLLSRGENTYDYVDLAPEVAFSHGGSAADLNGDGFPDLIVGTKGSPLIYLNDGKGNFKRTDEISWIKRAFVLELIDINQDGHPDLVFGSNEDETRIDSRTRIALNDGSGRFGFWGTKVIEIPGIKGAGVIRDFVFDELSKVLYVLRSGDRSSGNLQNGVFLQEFKIQSNESRLLDHQPDWLDPSRSYPFRSLRWIRLIDGEIVSDWGRLYSKRVGNPRIKK